MNMTKRELDLRKDAIYARQSIEKVESLSIADQIEKCKLLADNEAEEYIDRGKSGGNINRDELQRLLKDVQQKKIKKVIVYKLDRFSRNIIDFYNMWEILDKNKTAFVCVYDNFDTSGSTGRLMMSMLIAFAQMERENIQMRVKSNYYYRVENDGRWCGGPAPFGFRIGKTKQGISTLVEDEKEMEIVKRVFNMYAYDAYTSYRQISNKLAEMGAKSRRENGAFDGVTLARMMQNPVYVIADRTLYKYFKLRKIKFLNPEEEWDGNCSAQIIGKKPNNANIRKYVSLEEQSVYLTNFQGIIDSETYIKVQERMAKNEQIKKSNAPSKMQELSGKLKCKECGYAIHLSASHNNKKNIEYLSMRCHGRYELKICDVSFKGIKFTEIQKAVAKEIQQQLNGIAMKMISKSAEIEKKKTEIDKLQQEIDNLMELVATSQLPIPTASKQIEKRQKKIDEIGLALQRNKFWVDGSSSIPHGIPLRYDRFTMEEKKNIVNELIDKIFVEENGDIEIIWNI